MQIKTMAVGEKTSLTKIFAKKGDLVATHKHANEQCGYVLSGLYRLIIEHFGKRIDSVIASGESHAIPSGALHSLEVIAFGEIIEFFA